MSRLIFFAQPTNTEWGITKLESTLRLLQSNNDLPSVEKLLLIHTSSIKQELINDYIQIQKKVSNQLILEVMELPEITDFVNWKHDFGLADRDWVVLPNPGVLFGRIFHEIITSFDFREGNIGLFHHNPDGVTTTIYGLAKETKSGIGPPLIKMRKINLGMKQSQTLKIILQKSTNGKFNVVSSATKIPKAHQHLIEIENNGNYLQSKKYIAQHIDSNVGFGFESVTQSVLCVNRNIDEIYHSVYFGLDKRDSQEEDFFVMTKSKQIIWISCKFGGNYSVARKEITRLKLKPPLIFPKERIYSILTTSKEHAQRYNSVDNVSKTPDVFVCHLGNLNDTISMISNNTYR